MDTTQREGAAGDAAGWDDGELFQIAVDAVNVAVGRASRRHARAGGCPRAGAGRGLGSCERGCFDGAVDVLETVLGALRHRFGSVPTALAADVRAYATHAARSAVGEANRARRGERGTLVRPERIVRMAWARRALPDENDRRLLAHLITWLGGELPAQGGVGWPLAAWAARYGCDPDELGARIERVVETLRAADPARYERYIARPMAAKERVALPFSALDQCDDGTPVEYVRGRPRCARPLWLAAEPARPAPTPPGQPGAGQPDGALAERDQRAADEPLAKVGRLAARIALAYDVPAALARAQRGHGGAGRAEAVDHAVPAEAVRALRGALTASFGEPASRVAERDLVAALLAAASDALTAPGQGSAPRDAQAPLAPAALTETAALLEVSWAPPARDAEARADRTRGKGRRPGSSRGPASRRADYLARPRRAAARRANSSSAAA